MINVNPPSHLPTLVVSTRDRWLVSEPATDSKETQTAGFSLVTALRENNPRETEQNRIRRLKKKLEQLQQKTREANARFAEARAASHRNEAGRVSAMLSAKAQIAAANSATHMTLTALIKAEGQLSTLVDTTA